MTLKQIETELDAALAAKTIYNADFVNLKFQLSRRIDDATKIAQNAYLDHRGGAHDYGNPALDALYWLHLNPSSFANFFKKLEKITVTTDPQRVVLSAYAMMDFYVAPVAAKLIAVKTFVVKGRKPSAVQVEKKHRAEKCAKVVEALNVALVTFRKQYRLAYIRYFTARLERLQAALSASGCDLNKVHPFPNKKELSKKDYAEKLEDYNWSHAVTQGHRDLSDVYGSSTCYRQIKKDAFEAARKEAIQAADFSIDSYILKMAGKIGPGDYKVVYTGDLWNGSQIEVRAEDVNVGIYRVVQNWYTRCIINVSCLGTVFNQWPTRRVS